MSNDIVFLDTLLTEKRSTYSEHLRDDEYFEVFVFDQILKDYDLTPDELLDGRIGHGDDGGIDGFFAFVNGELVQEDTKYDQYKRNVSLELFLIQSKRADAFQEVAFDRASSTIGVIFDFTKDIDSFPKVFNASLLDKVRVFRDTYTKLVRKYPVVSITFVYASKGLTSAIHPKVKAKAEMLQTQIRTCFSNATVNVDFYGARELLEAARREQQYTLDLKLQENPISTSLGDPRETSYVALAKLSDYYQFVTDERGHLRRYIFESNVRDYQGEVDVNREIRHSLEDPGSIDFWWLNNGVTVIATQGSITGKTITLQDVQVVNGLQTTSTLHNHVRSRGPITDQRCILIKIVVTTDAATRDRIIKATNSQTAVPPASFRATDQFQRDIEDYFRANGWFYERRKNFYRNQGYPADRIIGIPYLAQAIMAILLRQPDNARARPTSLIKEDIQYALIFDSSRDPRYYLFCTKLMKHIDNWFRRDAVFSQRLKRNVRSHFATWVLIQLTGKSAYHLEDLDALIDTSPADYLVEEVLTFHFANLQKVLIGFLKIIIADEADADALKGLFEFYDIDRVMKGTEFVAELRPIASI